MADWGQGSSAADELTLPGVLALERQQGVALIKALARAFRYQRMLDEGLYSSITEMAAAERSEREYLRCLLRLTVRASDVVEGILDGRAWSRATLPALLEPIAKISGEQRNWLRPDT